MKQNRLWKLGVFALSACLLTGCVNQKQASTSGEEAEAELSIVATSVAACEILDALEIENIIGVPTTSYELPERYQEATEIGSAMSPDLEIVKSLNPSYVISPKSLESDLASQYEAAGLTSIFINLSSVEGMYKSIEGLGEIFDVSEQAEGLIAEFTEFMEEYQQSHEEEEAPTVLILMGLPGSYVVATENSYVGNLVELAGGQNVYAGISTEDYININTEDMVQMNPDIILRTAHALPEQVMEMFAEEFETNDIWKHFTAVQEGKVYDLSSESFGMSANLNYQDAIAELESLFYGQ